MTMLLRTGETNAWLASAKPATWIRREPLRVGAWTVSVQASKHHYSEPRSDKGPWSEVELGFPTGAEAMLIDWAEDASNPTETVYGWVPVDVVDTVIAMRRAAMRVRDGDAQALVMCDALRSQGVVTSGEVDPDAWPDEQRVELAHGLAILDAFSGEPQP